MNAGQSAETPAHFRDYAEAASRLCSATAGFEPDTGLRIGRTSARAGARRSIFPITGLSGAPAADTDTNLFWLHKRSINLRSHGRSTCCGSEKKFRKVHIRYARCTRFGCTYRGPIGVSTSRTPSVSFSIHMTWSTWKKTAYAAFVLERAIIAPSSGIGKQSFYLKEQIICVSWINLRKGLEMADRD